MEKAKNVINSVLTNAFVWLSIGSAIIAINMLTGCGSTGATGATGSTGATGAVGATGATGPQGPAASPTLSPSPSETAVQLLVDSENAYREGLGQTELSPGLSCNVQLIGSGQWLSASSPGYVAAQGVVTALAGSTNYTYLFTAPFNQPNAASGPDSDIPVPLQPLFESQNYKISCSGQIVVTTTDYYNFDVNSDDGSILSVDGATVVNNDGNHAITDKSGTKYLRQGVHTFSLLYAQSGGGNFGLVVQWNGSLVPGTVWYH